MNSRRLMGFPRQRTFAHYHVSERTWRCALRQIRVRDFRFGSNSEVGPLERHVRSTPNSRRCRTTPACPGCAAGSTDRRNTFCELLSWGLIEQGLSRPSAAPPDSPDPALAPWFESLKQPGTGASCCSIADCRTVDFRQDRDGYEVLIDGRWKISIPFWLRVPPNRIIDRIDNPTNRAVVCFTPEAGILCFVRPSES
jgi:hypothetical protein